MLQQQAVCDGLSGQARINGKTDLEMAGEKGLSAGVVAGSGKLDEDEDEDEALEELEEEFPPPPPQAATRPDAATLNNRPRRLTP